MSSEYCHTFISNLILGEFDVAEFDNFTALINSCTHPLFVDSMDAQWDLIFDVTDDKLTWQAIEYPDDDREDGNIVLWGTVQVVVKPTPPSKFTKLCICEDIAYEFIECLFPPETDVIQPRPNENIFFINSMYYDFDTMTTSKGKFIHFEFKQ